jgi:hypothetical protein
MLLNANIPIIDYLLFRHVGENARNANGTYPTAREFTNRIIYRNSSFCCFTNAELLCSFVKVKVSTYYAMQAQKGTRGVKAIPL